MLQACLLVITAGGVHGGVGGVVQGAGGRWWGQGVGVGRAGMCLGRWWGCGVGWSQVVSSKGVKGVWWASKCPGKRQR